MIEKGCLKRGGISAWSVIPLFLWTVATPGYLCEAAGPPMAGGLYERVVSMSPSTTEILFSLGLGGKVVGITRFCSYPPETGSIAKVGGFLDPNYEAVIALTPDLVILLPEQANIADYLDKLDINHITVDNKTIEDIYAAIITIGVQLGAASEAEKLVEEMRSRISQVSSRTEGLGRPRALISIGRAMGAGSLGKVYVAGKNTYYDELLSLAGGINACGERLKEYPMLSAEGIISLDPEVIIELVPDLKSIGASRNSILRDWDDVSPVTAVREGKLFILEGDYLHIPGPRVVMLLEDLAGILHPEAR